MQPRRLHIAEPWLGLILSGRKPIEGRRGPLSKFSSILDEHQGALILWNETAGEHLVTVTSINHYHDLYSFLDGEGWQNAMPTMPSRETCIAAYHAFYSDDSIASEGGICALHLRVVN
jgi:ASC-1-like (ASCH) protein